MKRSVKNRYFNISYRVSCKNTGIFFFNNSFFNWRNKLPRNGSTHHFRFKLPTLTTRQRFNTQQTMPVLSPASGLTNIFSLTFCLFGNSFFVSYLWLTYTGLHFKLSFHPVYQNFKLQLTHTGYNSLSCFLIRLNPKS